MNETVEFTRTAPSQNYVETIAAKAKMLAFHKKQDQELTITCSTATGSMRVVCLESTEDAVVVAHGFDPEGNDTFHCAPSYALQITMKIVKQQPECPKRKIGFVVAGREIGAY